MADNQRAKHGNQQPEGNRDAQKQANQGDQNRGGHQGQGDRDRAKGQENQTGGGQSGQSESGKQNQNR